MQSENARMMENLKKGQPIVDLKAMFAYIRENDLKIELDIPQEIWENAFCQSKPPERVGAQKGIFFMHMYLFYAKRAKYGMLWRNIKRRK